MKNPSTKEMRNLAERLLASESVAVLPSQASVPVAFRVCEKLQRPLTTLAGTVGFHSLMSRALTLSQREAPSLSAVRVNADGSIEGRDLNKDDSEGGVILVGHLLGLLGSVIGDTLTLRLIHDLWPGAYFNELTAEGTGMHEPQG